MSSHMIAFPTASARLAPSRRRSQQRPTGAASGLALEGGLLVLSFAAALFGAAHWIHPVWSLVALADYAWLCALLFRVEPRGAVLVLPQLISNASALVAMIMIEFGAQMFELGLVGRPGPWSSALNLCNLLFCAGVVCTIKPLVRALDRRGGNALSPVLDRFANLVAAATLALVGLIALSLIVRGLQAGFPLLAGTDRFLFRRFAADKVTLYALNLKFVIGYGLGFVAFILPCARWLRQAAGLCFAAMMVIYFLFGDKFFTQLGALSAFAAPYLYYQYRTVGRRIWIYAAAGALALAAVMTVTTYIYSKGFTETSAATTKRLSGRMVGQGELWFLQSSIGAPIVTWNTPLIESYEKSFGIKSIDLFAAQNSLGPHYFSNRYAPDYLRASLQRNAGSVTYTAVTEAMGLVLFGWLGLGVMMFAVGMLLGLAGAYIAYAITNRSILSVVFAAYVYSQLRTSIVQATPWVIGSIYSLRWLSLILMVELALLILGRSGSGLGRRRHGAQPGRRLKQATQPTV
jgi:hypothetical protein